MGDFLPLITGSAGALVFLALVAWAFYSGKLHSDSEFQALHAENDELKKALASERTALDEATKTGTVTNQLIGAIASLAAERRPAPAPAVAAGPDLNGEDLPL